jgi:hypothetical protein
MLRNFVVIFLQALIWHPAWGMTPKTYNKLKVYRLLYKTQQKNKRIFKPNNSQFSHKSNSLFKTGNQHHGNQYSSLRMTPIDDWDGSKYCCYKTENFSNWMTGKLSSWIHNRYISFAYGYWIELFKWFQKHLKEKGRTNMWPVNNVNQHIGCLQ